MSLNLKGSRCNFWQLRQNIKFTVVQLLCNLSPWQPHGNPYHLCFQLSFWRSGMQEIVATGSMHSWVKHTQITNLQLWPTHQHSIAVPALILSHILHTSNSFTDSSTLSTSIILNSFSPCSSITCTCYSSSGFIPNWRIFLIGLNCFRTGPLVDAISSTTHEWPTKIMSSTLQNSVPCMRA